MVTFQRGINYISGISEKNLPIYVIDLYRNWGDCMLKIAVCDDEPVFVEQISSRIKKYILDAVIQGFFSSEEILSQKEVFDIYFLDIQMEKMNGIETAKKLRESDEECVIVFITGAKEYVFEAFDVAAMHYLIKPVADKKLQEVLKRAQKEIEKKQNKKDRQIFIKTRNKSIILNVADVLYFENEMRKIIAHTLGGEISFYGVMADVEREAGEGFYRCHRGYLVNLSYVAEYDAESIVLINGEKIYLSKNRYPDFVRQYMRYLRNGGVSRV